MNTVPVLNTIDEQLLAASRMRQEQQSARASVADISGEEGEGEEGESSRERQVAAKKQKQAEELAGKLAAKAIPGGVAAEMAGKVAGVDVGKILIKSIKIAAIVLFFIFFAIAVIFGYISTMNWLDPLQFWWSTK